MRRFSILALIAAIILAVALAGCGGGGGGGGSLGGNGGGGIDNPPPPINDGGGSGGSDTSANRIIGKVVRSTDGAGVANVTVTFGTNPSNGQKLTAKSGSTGSFIINLPTNATVMSLFPGDLTFSVSTSGLSNYPTDSPVSFDENGDGMYTSYPQSAIPVSIGVLQGATTNLGSIIVRYTGSGSGGGNDTPPPAPF